jgi:hypothetical protein
MQALLVTLASAAVRSNSYQTLQHVVHTLFVKVVAALYRPYMFIRQVHFRLLLQLQALLSTKNAFTASTHSGMLCLLVVICFSDLYIVYAFMPSMRPATAATGIVV